MKNIKILVVLFTVLLVGCNHINENKTDTETNKEKKEISFSEKGILLYKDEKFGLLLINNKIPEKSDYFLQSDILVDQYNLDLIVIDLSKVNDKELIQGQKIEIWFDALKESKPPKATVKKYEIISILQVNTGT
ncbi:DUF3221 domain-containing protein [Bacillus sp. NPDC077027]|uniref:DUF3221 domain-containing protein n=1 Tax=Bacillus sp. NPDC077027 TaxID=3390548 RepID=UPI003D06D136